MAYEGNITLINGLIPANGQDFPLVKAEHVYVDDDTRLADFVETVKGQIDDLNYIPMQITSFSIVSPANGVAERGSTVTSITYAYACNKVPDSLTFDGTAVSNPQAYSTATVVGGYNLTSQKIFALTARDHGSSGNPTNTWTENATLYFRDKIHWGVAAVPSAYNDSFLLTTLGNHELAASKAKTFTVNAGSGQYIFFALPSSMGTPNFKVGGFDGGFQRVASFSHTNTFGAAVTYNVWKSDNANLGSTTVIVS